MAEPWKRMLRWHPNSRINGPPAPTPACPRPLIFFCATILVPRSRRSRPIIAGVLLRGRGRGKRNSAGGITNDTKPLQPVQLWRSHPLSLANGCEENGVRSRGHFRGGKVEEINFGLGSQHGGCVPSRTAVVPSARTKLTVECHIPEVVPAKNLASCTDLVCRRSLAWKHDAPRIDCQDPPARRHVRHIEAPDIGFAKERRLLGGFSSFSVRDDLVIAAEIGDDPTAARCYELCAAIVGRSGHRLAIANCRRNRLAW